MTSSIFEDRLDAGRQLAQQLRNFKGESPVILALPRGGLPIGYEIAKELQAPLDILLVRKIGLPGHEELAIGAVVDGARPHLVLNEEIIKLYRITASTVEFLEKQQLKEIERRRALYMPGRPPIDVEGKTAIVVDDGIATGATVRAALQALHHHKPKRLVLAVPVAPPDTLGLLREEADEIICLQAPHDFRAVGLHYRSFPQLTDEDVIHILKEADEMAMSGNGSSPNKRALS